MITVNQTNCPTWNISSVTPGQSIYVLGVGTWGTGSCDGSGALKTTILATTPPNLITVAGTACMAVTNGLAIYGTDNTIAWNTFMQSTTAISPWQQQLSGTGNGAIALLPTGSYLVDTTSSS